MVFDRLSALALSKSCIKSNNIQFYKVLSKTYGIVVTVLSTGRTHSCLAVNSRAHRKHGNEEQGKEGDHHFARMRRTNLSICIEKPRHLSDCFSVDSKILLFSKIITVFLWVWNYGLGTEFEGDLSEGREEGERKGEREKQPLPSAADLLMN